MGVVKGDVRRVGLTVACPGFPFRLTNVVRRVESERSLRVFELVNTQLATHSARLNN